MASSGYGSLVAFDELGYGGDAGQGRTIWLGDLATGSLRKLATAAGGDAASTPNIRGAEVAWVEWHYANNRSFTGALTWRIMLEDLSTGRTRVVRTGVSPAIEGPGGTPLVVLTDQTLVLAFPAPSSARRTAWEIEILSLPGLAPLRTLSSDQWIYGLAASDAVVAFTKGKVNPEADFVYDTTLMVAATGDSTPHELARNSFEVAVDGRRVVWVDDRAASQGPSPAAVAPRIYSAATPDAIPVALSPVPNREPIVGSSWPAAGDGYVSLDRQP